MGIQEELYIRYVECVWYIERNTARNGRMKLQYHTTLSFAGRRSLLYSLIADGKLYAGWRYQKASWSDATIDVIKWWEREMLQITLKAIYKDAWREVLVLLQNLFQRRNKCCKYDDPCFCSSVIVFYRLKCGQGAEGDEGRWKVRCCRCLEDRCQSESLQKTWCQLSDRASTPKLRSECTLPVTFDLNWSTSASCRCEWSMLKPVGLILL